MYSTIEIQLTYLLKDNNKKLLALSFLLVLLDLFPSSMLLDENMRSEESGELVQSLRTHHHLQWTVKSKQDRSDYSV